MLAVAVVLIAAASVATYYRNRVWASESALWEDTVTKSPNKLRGYGHLVHGLVREHHCREALQRLSEMPHRLKPDATLLSHWSFAYECVGEPGHALEKLEQSAALTPWPSTYLNMASHQLTLNQPGDALQSLSRALDLDPHLESAYLMRAGIFERQGDVLAAAPRLQTSASLESPRSACFLARASDQRNSAGIALSGIAVSDLCCECAAPTVQKHTLDDAVLQLALLFSAAALSARMIPPKCGTHILNLDPHQWAVE
jgi:tetratricopeptide (TPR) repeat protein